jgi:hypothetical protein
MMAAPGAVAFEARDAGDEVSAMVSAAPAAARRTVRMALPRPGTRHVRQAASAHLARHLAGPADEAPVGRRFYRTTREAGQVQGGAARSALRLRRPYVR